MDDIFSFGMNFDIANWPKPNKNRVTLNGSHPAAVVDSVSQSDNAAFRCDDEDNTKEEEVYQDLCAIQSSIARTRDQVFIKLP